MGIIKREGVKNTVLSYVGVIIGSLSALLIYPLDQEAYGLAAFLYSTAFFLLPFASFGVSSAITKFFPKFHTKNSNHNNGFLFFILSIAVSAYLIFLTLFLFFKSFFFSVLGAIGLGEANLSENYLLVLSLLFALLIVYIFTFFLSNYHKTVMPSFFQNFLYKIFLPIIVFLHYIKFMSTSSFSLGVVLFFVFVALALIVYTIRLGYFNIKPVPKGFLTVPFKKDIRSYLSFSFFNVIGHTLAFRIDLVMVAMMLGFSMNGTYGILFTLASTIDIPNRAILQIASPIISASWEKNDTKEIDEIYKKSSINLMTFGVFLFLGVWLCIDSLLDLSTNTKSLSEVKYIFFFLGLSKLVDMITSVNSQIIIFSKYYRYNLIFLIILGLVNVISNYYFIGEYNVIGAAIATLIAVSLYNIIKLVFIYVKMGFHPFSINIFKAIALGLAAYFIALYVPVQSNPFVNIIIKGTVFSMIYLPPVLYFNIAPDMSQLFYELVQKIQGFGKGKKH